MRPAMRWSRASGGSCARRELRRSSHCAPFSRLLPLCTGAAQHSGSRFETKPQKPLVHGPGNDSDLRDAVRPDS
jgi:hypothetical protein